MTIVKKPVQTPNLDHAVEVVAEKLLEDLKKRNPGLVRSVEPTKENVVNSVVEAQAEVEDDEEVEGSPEDEGDDDEEDDETFPEDHIEEMIAETLNGETFQAQTFADAGFPTYTRGVVLKVGDCEFLLSIVQTK